MASETSGRAKLGTAIALIGGAVGSGIVIYALMGGGFGTLPMIAEKVPEAATPAVEPTGTTKPSQAETKPETATKPVVNSGQSETAAKPVEDNAAPVETTEAEPPASAEIAPDANTEEVSQADPAEPTRTTNDAPAEPSQAEVAPIEDAPEDPQTEMASVEQPKAEAPLSPPGDTQSSVEAPRTPMEITPGDAPVVGSEEPVLRGAEPVVLQAGTSPSGAGPALDPSDPAVPKFDLVRIEADGSAVIAGRASPNAEVKILSNGEEIGTATASSRGEFVALIDTELTRTAQSLALLADAPSTGPVSSQSNVIVLARSATGIDNLDEQISLAPAIVQATPDEVRVIQPVVGLADLDRVSLDTISYDQAGQVILAGRGRPGFTARVYADGTSLSDGEISGSGTWSATINDLDVGRYVIRVDELDPSGAVASRVESPFQRIFPTAEQLALLTDATSVIVQPGNNLWTIAEGRYGEGFRYTTIFEANKEQIRNPDLIYPGQVFELPGGASE